MGWQDELADAFNDGLILNDEPQAVDIKIKVLNDPIGVDFEKTKQPGFYIAIEYMCNILNNITMVKKDFRLSCYSRICNIN